MRAAVGRMWLGLDIQEGLGRRDQGEEPRGSEGHGGGHTGLQ